MSMEGKVYDPDDPRDIDNIIEVFNSPEWSPRQALLSVLNSEIEDAQFICITIRDHNNVWKSAVSTCSVGDILTAARYLQLEADGYLLGEDDEEYYEQA